MNNPRVLLLELSERTSAKGNKYMAGWLGKSSVVAFLAKDPDKYGNDVWQVYVQEPRDKPRSNQSSNRSAPNGSPAITAQAPIDPNFNDSIEDIGR